MITKIMGSTNQTLTHSLSLNLRTLIAPTSEDGKRQVRYALSESSHAKHANPHLPGPDTAVRHAKARGLRVALNCGPQSEVTAANCHPNRSMYTSHPKLQCCSPCARPYAIEGNRSSGPYSQSTVPRSSTHLAIQGRTHQHRRGLPRRSACRTALLSERDAIEILPG